MQTEIARKQIDLSEVETALREQSAVEDGVVLAREAEPAGQKLVAYVVPSGPFAADRLHADLRAALPAGMVPSAYVSVSALPLTPAGEVDEQALARLEVIDADLVRRWEERLRELPGVLEAGVVVHDQAEPLAALHLADLLPGWKNGAGQAPARDSAGALPATTRQAATSGRPSISVADPLPQNVDEPTTLPEALRRAATINAARGALHLQHDGSEVFQSYPALREEAERILGGLRRLGLKPQDKVIFQLDCTQDYLAAFWGCVLGGLIPVPISIAPTYDQVNATVSKLHNAWEMLDRPVVLAGRELAPAVRSVAGLLGLDGFRVEEVDGLRDGAPDHDWHPSKPGDLAVLLLTSGSTGKPKGVMLSHRNLLAMAAGTAISQNFTSEDVTLNWMPLDHVGAISFLSCMATYLGCLQIHALTRTVLEDPLRWLNWIERFRATISWAPNFAFGLINDRAADIERGRWDLSSMRFLVSAGESVVARTARRFLNLFRPHGLAGTALAPAFGMSETCSGITWSQRFSLDATSDEDSFVEVGPPIPGAALRIVDDEGRVVEEGKVGHLQLRGVSVTSGYYQNPEVNREAFTADGWFRTGDLGFLREGRLTLTGRGKDVIIINGVNYYSHEIEAVVEEVEGVETSYTAACAVPGPGGADQLAIFLHAPEAVDGRLARLLAEVRGRVVRKIGVNPTYLIPVARQVIPKTEIGKIQRPQLRQRFEAGEFNEVLKEVDVLTGSANTLPDWFFRTIWRRKKVQPLPRAARAGLTLVFMDPLGLGASLGAELARREEACVAVEPGTDFSRIGPGRYRIDPADPEHYRRLVQCVAGEVGPVDRVLHLWTYDRPGPEFAGTAELDRAQDRGVYSLLFLVQALGHVQGADQPVRLLAVSSQAQPTAPADTVSPERAALPGLVKTVALEMPFLDCRHIDLPVDRPEVNAARLLSELESRADREVAYRGGRRLVPRLEKVDLRREPAQELPLKSGGTYLLSGGLGGIGALVARYLLENHQARLLLIGRTPLPERNTWDADLANDDEISRRIRALQRLEALGKVCYESADITDLEELRRALERARSHGYGKLDGVIHLAGAYHDRLLADETRASFAAVLAPKVLGTWALHQLVKDRPGCLFVSFSSAVGSFGGSMVGAYAAANRFLDAFAHQQRWHGGLRSHCFAWTTWSDVGMSRGYGGKEPLRARGIQDLSAEQGLNSLLAGLYRGQPHLVVGQDGSNPYIRRQREEASCQVQRLTAYVASATGVLPADCLQDLEVTDQFGTPSSCEVVPIREMPRTESGQIDRKRLAEIARLARGGAAERAEPRTEEERRLTEIWQQLLGVAQLGIHDNFFELGGHSLLATRVLTRMREQFGVELPVRVLFEAPTVAGLAERLQASRQSGSARQAPPLRPVAREGELPLSFSQQRLWFIDQLEPGAASYNVPVAFRLEGAVDMAALERALGEVLRRHEVLRTRFPSRAGQPVQVIAPPGPYALPVEDLSCLPQAEREGEARRRAGTEAQGPFDLANGPLFRARLLRLGDQDHVLLVTMHHIVSDGWSIEVFAEDLAALYEAFTSGRPSPLAELPVQYADYAAWQRSWLTDDVLQDQLDYWKQQLEGVPRLLELPADRPRPPVQSYRGGHQPFALPLDLSEQLKALSQKEGATLFMTLMAAFQALVGRYSGQERFIVSTAIANRDQQETEGLIGCLINILLVPADLSGNPDFRDLLGRVRETALGAYAHQDVPFEGLVEELAPERDLSYNPVTQVMFVLLSQPIDHLELAGLRVRPVEVDSAATPYDIIVHMIETPGGLTGFIDYSTDLYDADTIRRLLGHFEKLLAAVVRQPEQRLSQLPLLSEAERRLLVVDWNDTRADYPREQCLHELFEEQAARNPDAVAVVLEGRALTYAELDRRANRLAHYLRKEGVGPDVLMGLCVDRSLEMMVGLLGILKAGAAYVPLDPSYPAERLAFMLEDAQVRVLLTQERLLDGLPRQCPPVLCLDRDWEAVQKQSAARPASMASPENLAYVIYTSGSTGKPKGVQIPHRAVVNFLCSMRREPGLTERDTLLAVTTLSFDIAGLELFLPLAVGAKVVVAGREVAADGSRLAALLAESGATVMQATPATWRLLLEAGYKGDRALKVLCGGEALPRALANELAGCCGELWNMYGPTETTIWSATARVDAGESPVYLGRPIANTQLYVLDPEFQPLPIGVPGELYIGGDGLARGYYQRPELTAEKFVKDPFGTEPGARLYRTGDLVRYRADGNIEFLGRLDHQVKVRGFRIELGEVEAALMQHPAVREAVAVARADASGEKRLVAYLVADPQQPPTASDLRRHLKDQLPEHMIPSAFVRLEALPRTPNGKVDRKALPEPEQGRPELAEAFVAPRNADEEGMARIWAAVLGLERVGVHDNFFELGGHSLLATRVIHRIHEAFQAELPLRVLFEAPTVAGLAERLPAARKSGTTGQMAHLRPVPRDGELPLSFAQQRLWFIDQLEPGGAAYNIPTAFRLSGALDAAALERALTEILHRHEVLRTSFRSLNGRPVQAIASPGPCVLPVKDLSGLPESERQAEALRQANAETERPFDLARGPLVRTTLLRLGAKDHVLLVTMHHIVSDGWSLGVFTGELASLYEAFRAGRGSPLPELPIQYADYAAWQRSWLTDDVLQGQLEYWKNQLDGVPQLLEFPTDRARPPVQSYRGAHRTFTLPRDLSQRLKSLSQQQGVTLFMTLLAAFQTLLSRYSNQERFIVSTGVANRDRPETERLIGCLINILLLPADLTDNPAFRDLLGRVRETALGAYAHQDVPFERLVEELAPERDLSYNPLTQVMFVLLPRPIDQLALPGLSVRPVEVESAATQHDVVLHMWETPEGLAGMLHYSTDLFDSGTIARLTGHFRTLLESIVREPEGRVLALPWMPAEEQRLVVQGWNDTWIEYPQDRCVQQLFEEQAARTPDAVALVFEGNKLSYAELDRRANRLARALRQLGVRPDVRVGLCVERSLDMVVGLLGILKAGGAYVPLDPTYPSERLAFMLENSQARLLLTQQPLVERLPLRRPPVLFLDAAGEIGERESLAAPPCAAGPESLAYVIYTSGSTGQPKGVEIPHRAVVNFLCSMRREPGLTARDTLLAVTTLSFDIAGLELFLPLTVGARVVIAGRKVAADGARLTALLAETGTTVMQATPATWRLLLAAGWAGDPALKVLCGGEALPRALANDIARRCGELWNMYGPTETTIWSAVGRVEAGEGPVYLGRPIANTQLYVLDRELQALPVGVPGELHIGGDGLARGYHQRPELTAEKFIRDPFSRQREGRLYRTGDLVRWRPDGNLEFLGRLDHQVKVRGFRIELGEVEAALIRHPAVAEAVVLAREDRPGDKRLVAYLVFHPGQGPADAELRGFLQAKLPEYMVPAALVRLEALPRTPNGKIDRKALPAPGAADSKLPRGFAAPRTTVEEILAGICADVFGLDRVGVLDNFFEIGGHSLLATQIIAQVRKAFQVELPLRSFFEAPTIAGLAERLEAIRQAGSSRQVPPLVPVRRAGPLPLSFAQQRLWFMDQLLPGNPSYSLPFAFRLAGEVRAEVLDRSIGELLRRHEVLRTTFPLVDGQPVQAIAPPASYHLPVVDLGPLPASEREAEAGRLAEAEARRPFNLARGPLFRASLVRLDEKDHLLLLTVHHIAADGWSVAIFVRELAALYEATVAGRPNPLPELPLQYADYAQWQRAWLQGEVQGELVAYWKTQLAGVPARLELPADRPRPPVQTLRGARHFFELPADLGDVAAVVSRQQGTTLFMTLLAAFKAFLAGYTDQDDLVVGSPFANRTRLETDGVMGPFVNTLVLRTSLKEAASFQELLGRVRETVLGADAHQDLPFEKVVEAVRPPRDPSRNPLFQVNFRMMTEPPPLVKLSGVTAGHRVSEGVISKFDLALELWVMPGRFGGYWEYSTDLFDKETVVRMEGEFERLLRALLANPESRLQDLPAWQELREGRRSHGRKPKLGDQPREKSLRDIRRKKVDLSE